MTAQPAQAGAKPDDPAVIRELETGLTQMMPFLKRVGEVEAVKSGSRAGAAITLEGRSPTGVDSRVRAYITVVKGFLVGVLEVGDKEMVQKRDAIIRDVFDSIAWGEAEIDKELVGTWYYWSYKGSTLNTGLSSTEVSRTAVLNADGTFAMEGNVETYLSAKVKDSGGEEVASASSAGQRGSGAKGTWAAADGKLILSFSDGSYCSFRYEFKGQRGSRFLYLDDGGKKPEEWSERKIN